MCVDTATFRALSHLLSRPGTTRSTTSGDPAFKQKRVLKRKQAIIIADKTESRMQLACHRPEGKPRPRSGGSTQMARHQERKTSQTEFLDENKLWLFRFSSMEMRTKPALYRKLSCIRPHSQHNPQSKECGDHHRAFGARNPPHHSQKTLSDSQDRLTVHNLVL